MRQARGMRWSIRWWLSAASGALLALAFPPFDLPWPVIPIAIAIWFLCTHEVPLRTVMWRSLGFAMGFYLVLLKWMLVVGIDAWILLALLQSLYFLIVAVVRHRVRVLLLPSIAIAWVVQDWLRDHAPNTAFGWGQLAFAKIDAPWSFTAQLGGQALSTAVAAATGVALGMTFVGIFARRLIALGTLILAIALPYLVPVPDIAPRGTDRIALVQAGVDHTGLGFLGDRRSVLYRHRDLTMRELRNTDALAVLWPENASDADPFTDTLAANAIRDAANAANRPILLGAVIDPLDGRKNVALRALPATSGFEIVYQKQRLVPFGEYLPFRGFISRLTDRVEFLPRDFVPGNDAGDVRFGGHQFGIVICFEVADEELVRRTLSAGASALIVQTNNATYAGSGQSEQQLRISQLRARSLGVPVYVISTNGPTAVINERGEVVERVAEGDTGVILTALKARS